MIEREVILRNGNRMPSIGIGTSHNGGYSHSCMVYALKNCGYRLIDTAKRYGTEEFIKHAIIESKIDRENLFITSKIWPSDYGIETTRQALLGSLQRLGVDYLDLYLIHYPEVSSSCPDKWRTIGDTWRTMELLLDEGLVKSIGVSNYNIDDIEHQNQYGSMFPIVNQIEFHPYHCPLDLIEFCEDNKIKIQGYCPLGMGNLIKDNKIIEIADSIGRTPAQILINWSLRMNVPTIPKSTKPNRVKENIEVFDFSLDQNQMNILNNLGKNCIKYQDCKIIREKIDADLPDGYKLDINLREKLFES
ncbi:Transportin-1 [Sarcoptes scabiei]|nr:Transportin-1 [Sarcoptes scabiei]